MLDLQRALRMVQCRTVATGRGRAAAHHALDAVLAWVEALRATQEDLDPQRQFTQAG